MITKHPGLILSCVRRRPKAAPRFWNEGLVRRINMRASHINAYINADTCGVERGQRQTFYDHVPRAFVVSSISLRLDEHCLFTAKIPQASNTLYRQTLLASMVPLVLRGSKNLAYPTCIPRATRRFSPSSAVIQVC